MKNALSGFANDERGSMSIELLAVVPIMVWALLSTFVYFDVYRTQANVNRASLTIADMFSREQAPITATYMASAGRLLKELTYAELNPDLRVTVYMFDLADDRFKSVWSHTEGADQPLTTANLQSLRTAGRLPTLSDGEYSILVETTTDYAAPVNIGFGPFSGTDLDDVSFDTFVMIRSRYTNRLCFDNLPSDVNAGLVCDPV